MVPYNPVIQSIMLAGSPVSVLRLDLLDPVTGGNKWFKLLPNLERAEQLGFRAIATFGGPHSNHIAACAETCRIRGLTCTGYIRGSEVQTPTLARARAAGMQIRFVTRVEYDSMKAGNGGLINGSYVIPEGGANCAGVEGCAAIIRPEWEFEQIFCAAGTGATFAGLVIGAGNKSRIIGVSVLKGDNVLPRTAQAMIERCASRHVAIEGNEGLGKSGSHCITSEWALSGYARCDDELLGFKRHFEDLTGIPLDYVYTAKLFHAVSQMITRGLLPSPKNILLVHSGGLQGNEAFERRYQLMPSL